MILREEVTLSDRAQVASDFSPGDVVAFVANGVGHFGVIHDSSEKLLGIQMLTKLVYFTDNSNPTFDEALKQTLKFPDFDSIKPGVFMSKIVELSPGNYFRQYVEVLNVVRKQDKLKTVTLGYLNGLEKSLTQVVRADDWQELWKGLTRWEIEG